jgi:hypothetical protein
MAEDMGPFRDSQALSWLSGPQMIHVKVDFMTTSYVVNIKLSDKFNTKYFFQD